MARKGGIISEKPPSSGGDGGFGKDKNIDKDFGVYDRDDDSWIRGYVGGEVPGGKTRFGDCDDWDGDEGECCEVAEHEGAKGCYNPHGIPLKTGYKVIK